jgi:sulfonate transport system ATP-binding protein
MDGTILHAPPRGAAISLRAIARSFGANHVLRGVDLDIRPGEFLTVVGRSGCGKSTLLRILAGLDGATGGRLAFDGDEAARPGEIARLMFQEPRLLPWARVLANVEVGLGSGRTDRALAQAKLEEVGLGGRGGDWPPVLSGGQRQRVALARALVSRPRFLALDEPLGALDALTRIEMQRLLERVWQEEGFTALLVTHDVTEAIILGDRVVLIEEGVIRLELPVDLPRPRHRGSPEVAALEARVLGELFREDHAA